MRTHQLPHVARIQRLNYQASPIGDAIADMVEVQYTDLTQRNQCMR
jgi:hypothetical protein